ncbi:hypothetical protein GKA01_22590 [Gluconobacter kanchanaburiensis NBRC 103587]|uniref:Uncharacterized protein n=2 Tax=Gluconobacter kanchanaburiensis TaxID=563199 RepID=A0A511BB97_9PROT|nr:hypothetical protein AA103587_0827 [Gluconobacter kanchanaburiensis NBRC 103587]GEK97062.1 hypothetical protein GKA01_22590 [Gluconobacter kanchanaburiensis NBRC 103587]
MAMGKPAPTLQSLWAKGERARKSWALNAYEHFRMELSTWTQCQLPEAKSETTIVLCGPTQVGKTTLLLELLGVSTSELKNVSDTLRAGQPVGTSSTSIPMIYHESADEHWRLDNSTPLSVDSLKDALKTIRQHVEAGGMEHTRVATLYIPRRYFDPDRHALPRVRILDLPGIHPQNQNEAEFVRSVAQKYVPTADLVLLITRADSLSFLNPETLTEDGLWALDWRLSPARFCIVTTYACKFESVQIWLDTPGKTCTVSSLRQRCAEQLDTFGITPPPPDCLFPLDFGDSWANAPARRRELAGPLMNELRQELCERIANAADPLGRLHHVRDAFNIAVKLDSAALMHLNDAQRDADLAMRKRKSALNKYKKQQEKRKKRLVEIGDENSISNASHEVRLEFEKNLKEMLPRLPAADDTSAMKKSYLRRFSLNFQTALWRCISRLESLDSDNEYTSKILTFLIAELREKENNDDAAFFFEEFIKKIDSPIFDNYWLLVPGPKFIADRAQLGSCMEKATIWLRERFAEACNRAVKVQKNALKQQQTRMRRGLQRVQARIEQLEGDGAAQQDAMMKQAKEIANLRGALAADRQRASEFDEILRAALRKDLRARRDAMITETVPTKRFLQLIEAVTISYRFRERFTTLLASTEDLQ